MSRGNEKMLIFIDYHDRQKFLSIVEDYHERYSILIHSYVLMRNHYHLILETPRGNLLKVMHGINSAYTGYFNRRHSRVGHLFQGRYKAILVEKEVYLVQLSRYIHLNPVRAGFVQRPEVYPWSSYPGYVADAKERIWVEYSWILSQFDAHDSKRARKRYKKYVDASASSNHVDFYDVLYGKTILGSETFISRVIQDLKDESLNNEIVERKRFIRTEKSEEIIRIVSDAFKVNEERIVEKRTRSNIARSVAIYFVHRYSGLSNREIGNLFGGIQPSAVSKVCSRLFDCERMDPGCREKIRSLDEVLKSQVKA
jgi:REP element-mobilizing transposase RayT